MKLNEWWNELNECSCCGELFSRELGNHDEGNKCHYCKLWFCNACAKWTPKKYDPKKFDHLNFECRTCREERESNDGETVYIPASISTQTALSLGSEAHHARPAA